MCSYRTVLSIHMNFMSNNMRIIGFFMRKIGPRFKNKRIEQWGGGGKHNISGPSNSIIMV